MIKNNIIRLLDTHRITYQVFELSAEKHGAMETARLLGVPAEQVFKTIVVNRPGRGKPILAIIPGIAEVDLKLLANAIHEKKLILPSERQAETLTGLQAGGISPLALLNRGFEFILDETAELFDEIHISGGQRGLNILLPVKDLIILLNARLADISKFG